MRATNKHLCLILGALITLAGWPLVAQVSGTNASEDSVESVVPGPLDGMTFSGALGPDGKPKDIADSFVFENGNFVSKECELRCKYPPRPYFVRVSGSKTEFISETRCPYKDARIVWRGTIEGGRIKGKSTWVVKRWYWTIEDTFEFEGELVSGTSSPAVID